MVEDRYSCGMFHVSEDSKTGLITNMDVIAANMTNW